MKKDNFTAYSSETSVVNQQRITTLEKQTDSWNANELHTSDSLLEILRFALVFIEARIEHAFHVSVNIQSKKHKYDFFGLEFFSCSPPKETEA